MSVSSSRLKTAREEEKQKEREREKERGREGGREGGRSEDLRKSQAKCTPNPHAYVYDNTVSFRSIPRWLVIPGRPFSVSHVARP